VADAISARVRAAEHALGVTFRDPTLLQLALVHSSLLNEPEGYEQPMFDASNERLEFLGDAALSLLVAEYLYDDYPDVPEGRLTVYRAILVRRETLARWARELSLDDLLFIGRGETQAEIVGDRILAGAFEAVLAAVYLDQGLDSARAFLKRLLDRDAAQLLAAPRGHPDLTNYKGLLQERIQRDDTMLPAYVVVSQAGPDHERQFVVEVRHRGRTIGHGSGRSKRAAEQAAARDALARFQCPATITNDSEPAATDRHIPNGAGAH
jgi:ribonuclease-3